MSTPVDLLDPEDDGPQPQSSQPLITPHPLWSSVEQWVDHNFRGGKYRYIVFLSSTPMHTSPAKYDTPDEAAEAARTAMHLFLRQLNYQWN